MRSFLLSSLLLAFAMASVHAEIIRRVNPDGTMTFIVPQKVPSGARTGPCGVDVNDIRTLQGAREAYASLLGTLRLDPNSVACRQALAVVGRVAGLSEATIANDLNASAPGSAPLPLPASGELPGTGGPSQ